MIAKKSLLFTEREYQLAMQIVKLQDALDTANHVLKEDGKLGVLPDIGGPSFRESSNFHKRVREIIKNA